MSPRKVPEGGFKRQFRTNPEVTRSVFDLVNYFEASEHELIKLMAYHGAWQKEIPSCPVYPDVKGHLEFGLAAYWINNPSPDVQARLDQDKDLNDVWEVMKGLLDNKIEEPDYQALKAALFDAVWVAADGTLIGFSTYEQLDPGWLIAVTNYHIVYYLDDRADFNTTPATISLTGAAPDQVVIALVGDWGTGAYDTGPAQDIIGQVVGMNPDYIVHLGDVYYAGTGGDFLPLNEEVNNFLAFWPTGQPAGSSFMLNSNHEMYSGAKGYYTALADPRFAAQQNTSYFALQYGGWTLLGLDSAYYNNSNMFMDGSLGADVGNTTQQDWVQGLGIAADKTIVMTHHTGLDAGGETEDTPFCNEVNTALGGDPAAWYWGHIHNGIVYNTPTSGGRNTLSRCVGHGAIPFGAGTGIAGQYVSYYAHTPDPALPSSSLRVLNGFAVLTISSTGTVTEEFFEQGNGTAVYTNTYS